MELLLYALIVLIFRFNYSIYFPNEDIFIQYNYNYTSNYNNYIVIYYYNVMRTHNSDIIYSYSHIIIMYQKQLKLSQAFMPPSTEAQFPLCTAIDSLCKR